MSFSTTFELNQDETSESSRDRFPIFLLDGGMGTTLEDIFYKDITHPLWTTFMMLKDESVLEAAHLQFLEAGSEVILTPTYQASYETFRRAMFTDESAEQTMHDSVKVAVKAKKLHASRAYARPRKIALSLGPFAATLDPTAEFTGIYPPPYGSSPTRPKSPSTSHFGRGPFTASEESSFINALSSFHFARLLVYASNPDVWNAIDIIAFETVPLLMEAVAIRKAMFLLNKWFSEAEGPLPQLETRQKPWYISFVFPGPEGQFLEYKPIFESDVSAHFKPQDLASRLFSSETDLAIPNGIGVNCTDIMFIPRIIDGYTQGVRELNFNKNSAPWLIVCPNGGVNFDSENQAWKHVTPEEQEELKDRWTKRLVVEAKLAQKAGTFGGLLIGGCCKTTPEHIKLLKTKLNFCSCCQ